MTPDAAAAPAWPSGRVGHVALAGRPNTGKSTFLNTVLGMHLAPVSRKPQTTRSRLLGVFSGDGMQILFVDTPGLFRGDSELDRAMVSTVHSTLHDADVVLCLADATRAPGPEDALVMEAAAALRKPVLVGINKTDVATPDQIETASAFWKNGLPDAPQFRFAAPQRETLDAVLAALAERLPEGPFLYEPDAVTDTYERKIGAELIRETVLEELRDEVPHAVAVEIESWGETGASRKIRAILHVERPGQKAILIGKAGSMIQKLTRAAQPKLAELCGSPVRLELFVKVTEDWRRRREFIKKLGLFERGP